MSTNNDLLSVEEICSRAEKQLLSVIDSCYYIDDMEELLVYLKFAFSNSFIVKLERLLRSAKEINNQQDSLF